MKTIIHITLSDVERNDLARRIDRNPDTKRLVTRKEVTEYTLALIAQEISDGQDIEVETAPKISSAGASERREEVERVPHDAAPEFVPSRGDEAYLAQPRDPGIAAACSRILDDTALIEQFAWDTVERNRKK